ncbi:coenzyme PQQ synthesis protein [Bifidobacterium tissieri]|uniref:Coenzyme PQQ synthesis protein n=1 Tax=Bifidobacterium tissieri TaxID=1630162 RepID=A0A261FJR1_9BIFI|nr:MULTISPECIES: PqqD family protein [Bifidobacterium]OZG59404.1 coenzyme PQQ synthesis protein [Bifidobacterium tissieri]TPF97436.1 pyrroloquinoline quinone biosynthesis protein [Bifidobacterium sp. UTCIF-39]
MRVNNGFVMRDVAGQTVIVATGEASKNFNGMIKVNETGRIVWQELLDGSDETTIVDRIVGRFGVDRDVAESDVHAFIDDMRRRGFLSE